MAWRRLSLALSACVLAVTAVPGAASAHPTMSPRLPSDPNKPWCATAAAPCIVSAVRNGVPVAPDTTDWTFFTSPVQRIDFDGGDYTRNVDWELSGPHGYALPATATGDVWSITFVTGGLVPRTSWTQGSGVSITRQHLPDGTYDVTVTGSPTLLTSQQDCDTSHPVWTCPLRSSEDHVGFFGSFNEEDQRGQGLVETSYGLDWSSNIDHDTGLYPDITSQPDLPGDPLSISIQLANQHEFSDGSLFHGFARLTIPDAFLKEMGVDSPNTLTAGSLSATAGVGSVTIVDSGTAVTLTATGLTFSQRHFTVRRGTVTPTAPTSVTVRRMSPTAVAVAYAKAKARGSRITSYTARCVPNRGVTRTATGTRSPLIVRGLVAGVTYRCSVRADAKAGHGTWSGARRA